jgi:TonB-dependent receptor
MISHRRAPAHVVVTCCLAAGMASAPAAYAQRRIVISPRPLDRALLELARQSGRNILFAPGSLAGLTSGRVDAAAFDHALRQMVAGLPLRVIRQPAGVALVRRKPEPMRAASRGRQRPRHQPPAEVDSTDEILVVGTPVRQDGVGLSDPLWEADTLSGDRAPTTDRNLAEAVARMPGVLTLTTNLQGDLGGNDRAARAEGQFAAIRGLGGAYSVATIDGVVLPQSMPYGRDAQLGMLPSFGFASLQLIKTGGAERAGDATGATLEVRSPSAFDAGSPGLQIVATVGLDESARAYRQDAGYAQFGLRFARRFDAGETFGLAISAQLGRRAFANGQQTYQAGTVEFREVDASGRSPAGLDPAANLLLTSVNAQFTRGVTRSASAMAALEYRPSTGLRLFARLSYAGNWTEQDIFQLGFQGGNRSADITRTPLGGGRFAQRSTGGEIHYWYQTNPERSHFLLGQLGGAGRLGESELRFRLHWSEGLTSRPDHVETSFWGPAATRLENGITVDARDGYPVPRLTAADLALANRVLDYPVRLQAEVRDQRSDDRRWGADTVLTRSIDAGRVRLVEGGLSLARSRRSSRLRNLEYQDLFAAGTRLGDTGLVTSHIDAILPGIYDFALPLIGRAPLRARIDAAGAPVLSPDEANGQRLDVDETVLAGFVRTRIAFADLMVTAGLRAERARVNTRYWLAGNDGVDAAGIDYGWNRGSAGFDALLPSLALRWPVAHGRTLHAALWTSYARPAANQLAGGETFETTGSGTLQIHRGNPDLDAVRAINLDAAFEWQGRDAARLSVALFGKRLAHFLYDAGSEYNNAQPGDEAGAVVIEPRNGGTARVAGIELSGTLPLARLDPTFAGWRVSAQATLLHARVRLGNPLLAPVEHMQYAPDYNLSAELGYAQGRWSTALTARWTGAYLQQYGLFGVSASGNSVLNGSALDIWVQPARQLDFNLARDFGTSATIRVFARNLLADPAYRSTIGRYTDAVPQTIATGRLVGVRIDGRF